MPYRTIPSTSTRYALIAFDENGKERNDPDGIDGRFSDRVLKDAQADPPTNVFFFSHGWKGDIDSAKDQYDRWITAMNKLDADKQKMGSDFKPLWIGLHWPSQAWGQEELKGGAFDELTGDLDALKEHYVKELGDTPEVRDALNVIFQEQENNAATLVLPQHVTDAYNRLAAAIGYTAEGPGSAPEAEGTAFDPEAAFEAYDGASGDFAGGFLGRLLGPLRQLTFWTMKFRGRSIGEGGMQDFIARLQEALPKAYFHLMGHSFGCVVVSSILEGKDGKKPLLRAVDSLVLAQGALSLWAYADNVKNEGGKPGYFNAAFRHPAVRGPIVVTRSQNDKAVGMAYPLAVALVLSNPDFANEDLVPASLPLYGGLGTFGMRNVQNAVDLKMKPQTEDYAFENGKIYNLQSDAFIPDHNGIDGPEVAHAIWQAALHAMATKTIGGAG